MWGFCAGTEFHRPTTDLLWASDHNWTYPSKDDCMHMRVNRNSDNATTLSAKLCTDRFIYACQVHENEILKYNFVVILVCFRCRERFSLSQPSHHAPRIHAPKLATKTYIWVVNIWYNFSKNLWPQNALFKNDELLSRWSNNIEDFEFYRYSYFRAIYLWGLVLNMRKVSFIS